MSQVLLTEIGSHSASPFGLTMRGRRTLVLNAGDAADKLGGAYAVVDADVETADQVHGELERAFRPGTMSDGLVPGREQEYVSLVLGLIDALHSNAPLAVTLAVAAGRDMIVATLGGGRVYVRDASDVVDALSGDVEASQDSRLRVRRTTFASGDSLLLVGPEVVQLVSQEELRNSLFPLGAYSPKDVASRLVSLAVARGGRAPSALVVHFATPSDSAEILPRDSRDAPRWKVSGFGVVPSVLAGIALCGLVLLGSGLLSRHQVATSSIPRPGHVLASHVRQRGSVPVLPAARSAVATHTWHFAPLAASGRVLLAVYNPHSYAVSVHLRLVDGQRSVPLQVRVAPLATSRVPLSSGGALTVRSDAAIVPMRLVVGGSAGG